MNAIVGYTGFVGSNLYTPERFQAAYNSKNIETAYGTEPDLLVYSGVRAEKFLANSDPEKDRENIEQAKKNIENIQPKKLVLISTIDVFRTPIGVDETSPIETENLHPYGYNRYLLEQWVRTNYPDALIVRLPALFGKNLKKNFIYDYIHLIPSMLKEDKYKELANKEPKLKQYYKDQKNGFRKAIIPNEKEKQNEIKKIFTDLGFSALNFTDSRSTFQFYNLARLWDDIQTALNNSLTLLHLATEPIRAGDLYRFLTGKEFQNELPGKPVEYDYRTCHAKLYGKEGPYLCTKDEVMQEIKEFVNASK